MFRRIRVFGDNYAAVCKHRSRMGRLDRTKRNAVGLVAEKNRHESRILSPLQLG